MDIQHYLLEVNKLFAHKESFRHAKLTEERVNTLSESGWQDSLQITLYKLVRALAQF